MIKVVIENPTINLPFDEATCRFRFTPKEITDSELIHGRVSSYFAAIPRQGEEKSDAGIENAILEANEATSPGYPRMAKSSMTGHAPQAATQCACFCQTNSTNSTPNIVPAFPNAVPNASPLKIRTPKR
jgi:hypothetical protein